MTSGPLLTDVIVTFCLAAGLLYRYGNWQRHNPLVTVAVLIAWYFSLLIIFVLPLDVSSTVFRQCVQESVHLNNNANTAHYGNITVLCAEPWSNVPENVLFYLWRIVYWSSQFLTWIFLPLMQSYAKAGEFTFRGKLKSALVDNAIYYGSYLLICGILLIYIAINQGLQLDGQKLKAIASSASNTWGLFLLVLLLGYALVEIPRALWLSSSHIYTLNLAYFKASKLSTDKCEAEETLDDILDSVQSVACCIRPGDALYGHLETIMHKIPLDLRQGMKRRQRTNEDMMDPPTLKVLVRLHKQLIKALQTYRRCETQWELLVERVIFLEDVTRNQMSRDHRFKPTFPPARPAWVNAIYTPAVEWYWHCVIKGYLLRTVAVISAILSAAVVLSEVTFFNKRPVLSIFANFLNVAKANYDYFSIELLSTVVIGYLCFCAYSTVLKIRVLNYYYLAPHHMTDEHSLIFSGMLLCRLTPPLCLNFLGLIHMDSHIIKSHIMETYYTQVMGHMDVVSIISDGFNIYFPMAVLAFCLATYFNVGSRVLSFIGFQQFLDDDDLTTDLIEEGKELVNREKRHKQRCEETAGRRRMYQERFGSTARHAVEARSIIREDSSRSNLLAAAEPIDSYQSNLDDGMNQEFNLARIGQPPRGLFDDI
ncbi:LMBR1 domain-containing protein 2 homolog [Lycorma delicatula]|uniref:LMBR1 domain-containing protein 2 homolog n=1 Tax=Lycorma delicatula TaxID=130591 RepID=UPI003F511766